MTTATALTAALAEINDRTGKSAETGRWVSTYDAAYRVAAIMAEEQDRSHDEEWIADMAHWLSRAAEMLHR